MFVVSTKVCLVPVRCTILRIRCTSSKVRECSSLSVHAFATFETTVLVHRAQITRERMMRGPPRTTFKKVRTNALVTQLYNPRIAGAKQTVSRN